jgi:hypothetical protein
MYKVVEVKPLTPYRLWLRFAEGAEGEVDLSDLADKGVFASWRVPGVFAGVAIGPSGELRWGDEVDLCPDALYLRLTGKCAADIFPALREAEVDARA